MGLEWGNKKYIENFLIIVLVEHHSYSRVKLTHFYLTHHRMWLKMDLLALSTIL